MATFSSFLAVGLGSALGGMARFGLMRWGDRSWGTGFPWMTLLINVSGSLLIGVLLAWFASRNSVRESPALSAFAMSGFCGGFTTFSAFSLQTLELLRAGRIGAAGANAALSVVLCVAAAGGGWLVGTRLR